MAQIDPTYDYDTFRTHLAKLNRLIKANMPFLRVTFRITELNISIVLSNSIWPTAIKEAFYDSVGSKTTVVVQFTTLQST